MPEIISSAELTPLRKAIAAHMSDSTQTVPHFRLVCDIDVTMLMQLRATYNARPAMHHTSITHCILKATADAIHLTPINCHFSDNKVHSFADVDLTIVAAVPNGLATPVLRAANRKSLSDVAAETQALVARARAGALRIAEMTGGSFSVSNLGPFGVDQFDAIISPPQCGILALGSIRRSVVASPEGSVEFRSMLRATLSADHRVIDGAAAAKVLSAIRQRIEDPAYLFV